MKVRVIVMVKKLMMLDKQLVFAVNVPVNE
jgi:hypothetical protein